MTPTGSLEEPGVWREMEVRPLTDLMVERYFFAWRDIETSFLDTAGDAVTRADELVSQLLRDRGYLMEGVGSIPIPTQAAAWARAYAAVQPIALLNARNRATMQERREAMARYRRLLLDLLRSEAPRTQEVRRLRSQRVDRPRG